MREPLLIDEVTLCRGKRVELVQRIYRYGEDLLTKDVIKFGQSIAVTPFKDDRNVILIRQFRAAINRWILEIPAGRIEHGESPEQAVLRELKEEIGYEARYIKKLSSIYLSPGYSDEVIHLYIAKDLIYTGAKPEKGELIEVIEVNFDKALDILTKEEVVDAKTLISLLIVRHFFEQGLL